MFFEIDEFIFLDSSVRRVAIIARNIVMIQEQEMRIGGDKTKVSVIDYNMEYNGKSVTNRLLTKEPVKHLTERLNEFVKGGVK